MASKEEEAVDALRARYEAAGQGHVFAHWDKCDEGERDALAAQLRSVNLDHVKKIFDRSIACLLYTSPSPRDQRGSRMPSSA